MNLSKVRRVFRLNGQERRLLRRALWTVALSRLLITVAGYRRSELWLLPPMPEAAPERPPQEAAWAVRAAARLVPGASCLVQALALARILRLTAHPALIRIGVAKSPDSALAAHAWVESDGSVMLALPGFEKLVVKK